MALDYFNGTVRYGYQAHCINNSVGVGSDICPMTTMSCCPLSVEESMEDATSRTLDSFAPEYRDYLDLSDVMFFDHYGKRESVSVCMSVSVMLVQAFKAPP